MENLFSYLTQKYGFAPFYVCVICRYVISDHIQFKPFFVRSHSLCFRVKLPQSADEACHLVFARNRFTFENQIVCSYSQRNIFTYLSASNLCQASSNIVSILVARMLWCESISRDKTVLQYKTVIALFTSTRHTTSGDRLQPRRVQMICSITTKLSQVFFDRARLQLLAKRRHHHVSLSGVFHRCLLFFSLP